MKKPVTVIQIGDKPGWEKPVLNVMVGGDSISIPITKKIADKLKEMGVSVEG